MNTTAHQSAQRGAASAASDVGHLRLFVFALFFIFGGITSLNDIVIPKLKELFTLSYAQVMLVQTAFFGAYFIISLPAASVVQRIGYMRAAVLGLAFMTAGCLLFIPASAPATFGVFLGALFVLAIGITVVQVVANPLISLLGTPATAHSRLTFAQAFNSLGTTVFPFIGARLILGSIANVDPKTLSGEALRTYRVTETHVIESTYLGLAIALVILALLVWFRRNQLRDRQSQGSALREALALLQRVRFAYGALCIFLYVGAEVAIGSLMVSYLSSPGALGLSQQAAGERVPLYWGGAMIGRFVGAYLLRVFSPGKVLAVAAACDMVLLAVSSHSVGAVSGWTLIAIGLFNSIMFPTIFSLASEGLGTQAAEGSGLICVAIVGGAVIPPLTGKLADMTSLKTALILPALCYLGILGFGIYARRPAKAL